MIFIKGKWYITSETRIGSAQKIFVIKFYRWQKDGRSAQMSVSWYQPEYSSHKSGYFYTKLATVPDWSWIDYTPNESDLHESITAIFENKWVEK